MASVVIFGLSISTVLTLVVVPTLYAIIETQKDKLASVYNRLKRWYVNPFEARGGNLQQ
jgi:multidrug efflux pump